jgi:D-glycerate 3-kinase
MSSAVEIISAHILAQFNKHRGSAEGPASEPLFVAIQGPQGSGKTYLTSQLCQVLESPPHLLSVATASIDDFYAPYSKLVEISESCPQNLLLNGRGHPGTHDLELARNFLKDLRSINEPVANGPAREVSLPCFDKSLRGGAGDRVESKSVKRAPVDVVVMEGWCMGFCPITLEEIDKRWSELDKRLKSMFSISKYRKQDVVEINQHLKNYLDLWNYFGVCVQVRVRPLFHTMYFYSLADPTYCLFSVHFDLQVETSART